MVVLIVVLVEMVDLVVVVDMHNLVEVDPAPGGPARVNGWWMLVHSHGAGGPMEVGGGGGAWCWWNRCCS